MTRRRTPGHRVILLCLGAALGLGCGAETARVVMETEAGEIVLEIDAARAPLTAVNFLRYVDEARLAGAHFYRVVHPGNQPDDTIRIEVLQGGLGDDEAGRRLPPIAHETTEQTGIMHRDGTISMARNAPGSASSEFFICIGDQPELDFGGRRNPDGQGFAAFGHVVRGMDLVRAIQAMPADGQRLERPVAILAVRRDD